MAEPLDRQRIDKWLWAARFYKTRALAVQEIERGRVLVAGQAVKPAREVKAGDMVTVRQGPVTREVQVLGLSAMRGPAPQAQQLYAETPASVAAREQAAAERRLAPEPSLAMVQGRPTKRDRRALDEQRRGAWGSRWSASVDDGE
ncbi:MAG: RNA-binding S4 domain-containing protein [Pseudomonadota bacterium]|nr:RNA-binding S4 domain-containing protein [Pseudomonadota bacterium]